MHNLSVIGASWLQEHDFCEQKLYLNRVRKIPLIETKDMKKGSEIHEQKFEEFEKEAVPVTWDEFFQSEEFVTSREVELQHTSQGILLLGRIDDLSTDKDGIYIVDEKPQSKPFKGTKLQLWAYCYLLSNNFKDLIEKSKKDMYAVLKNRDTGYVVWKEKYGPGHKESLIISLLHINNLLLGKRNPEPTKNQNKCRVCQYNTICEYSLVK